METSIYFSYLAGIDVTDELGNALGCVSPLLQQDNRCGLERHTESKLIKQTLKLNLAAFSLKCESYNQDNDHATALTANEEIKLKMSNSSFPVHVAVTSEI